MKVLWVDYEDMFDMFWTIRVKLERAGFEVIQLTWTNPESSGYGVIDLDRIIEAAKESDVVLLHFGTGIKLGEAYDIISQIKITGARIVVTSEAKKEFFPGADATISKNRYRSHLLGLLISLGE
jgi:hypothetical protein